MRGLALWFDPEAPRREFDPNLFGFNPYGFAHYADPDRYAELFSIKAPRLDVYRRLLPNTYEAAEGMFSRIHQRREWGLQISPKAWAFETAGKARPLKKGIRYSETISLLDILKHLTGRSGYARGTSDKPIPSYKRQSDGSYRPNFIPAIRFDIDIDRAFRFERSDWLVSELESQRRVIEATGLPYRVFRTGSRGVQLVVPLPLAVPPILASLYSVGLKEALAARGTSWAQVDKDNLSGLLRLPGGVHAKTGDLGLWVDVAGGKLFDLDDQVSKMTSGLAWTQQDSTSFETREYEDAANQIIKHLRARGYDLHRLVDRDVALQTIERMPSNLISKSIEAAIAEGKVIREEFEVSNRRRPSVSPSETDPIPSVLSKIKPEIISTSSAYSRGGTDWASAVWDQAYQPGEHWQWISMGGKMGILAAHILFGADGAEEALLELSRRIGAVDQDELIAREHAIRSLVKSFDFDNNQERRSIPKSEAAIVLGETDDEVEAIASDVVANLLDHHPKPRWSVTLASRLVVILLIGMRDSETGRYRVSFGDLAEQINQRWPDANCNRQRVSQMIPRITLGKECIVGAFQRFRGKRWDSIPDEYALTMMHKHTELFRISKAKYNAFVAAREAELDAMSHSSRPQTTECDLSDWCRLPENT
jgi:hypothetical protein